MSIEGLLIGALILLVFVAYLALPFFRQRGEWRSAHLAVARQRERLTLYYERVLHNVHDLDEDFATGKLDPDEYASERELWAQRGIAALKALDNLSATNLVSPERSDEATIDRDIESAIEAAVAAYKIRNTAGSA